LARGANPGTDQALAEEWVGGSRNFATKLWNATRFAMMNGANIEGALPESAELNAIDRWILSRLNETIRDADALFERYEFAKASELIYHFAWDNLCDWYLELAKANFSAGSASQSQRVLGHVLDQLLRLLHPLMPFITEELWVSLTGGESLVIAQWPKAQLSYLDPAASELVAQMQVVITEVRRFRNDQGVKATARIPGRLIATDALADYLTSMEFLLKLENKEFTPTATLEIGSIKCELDLSGTVDVVAERARLTKDLALVQKDKQTAEVKLNNEGFMAKAPMSVVAEIKERLIKTQSEIERITSALGALPKL
jgi:valyl-tRNA synthetase